MSKAIRRTESGNRPRPRVRYSVILLAMAGLSTGCASLPPRPPGLESQSLSPPPGQGVLAVARTQAVTGQPEESSSFLLLKRNVDALQWRLALIDHAVSSIDLQYFIWEDDETGRLLLDRLLQAAERGVRVRILADDFPVRGSDTGLALLSRRPNFEIRLFNPRRVRRGAIGPVAEFFVNFGELNRRMHNKLMLVDGQWAVVGGRNIGNPYFGLSPTYNFVDLDVLITGAVLAELGCAFDEYWNSDPSYPGGLLAGTISARKAHRASEAFAAELAADRKVLEQTPFSVVARDWSEEFSGLPERMVPGTALYLQDNPIVRGPRGTRLLDAITELEKEATSEILLATPYLIPPHRLLDGMRAAVDRGVDVSVLTASLAANNHTSAHSHYRKYRKSILGSGATLHEFNHQPTSAVRALADTSPCESAFVSLHIKAMVDDQERVYLGSLNLDPRAIDINTENALVIESPALGERAAQHLKSLAGPGNAWRVSISGAGHQRWVSGDDIRRHQPARSSWQRIADFFWRLLPIESQL